MALAVPASADELQQCVSAYEQAQRLRKQGKLIDARQQLHVCLRDACDEVLRKDCSEWLDQVERALPAVVVEVRDNQGRDVLKAAVKVDGSERGVGDGRAIELDPGAHVVEVSAEGMTPIREQVLLREGERDRKVRAVMVPVKPPASARPVPVTAYLLGGMGIAALAVTGVFGAKGLSDRASLDDRGCKPNCPSGDVDSIRTSYMVANISLGVGVLSLAAATWVYVARPAVPVGVQVGQSGGMITWQSRF